MNGGTMRHPRIKGIPCPDAGHLRGDYFLLLRSHTLRDDEYYVLSENPGLTNMSREERLSGWLGTTNDVALYAEGAVRVYEDKLGRVRIKKIDPQEVLDSAEAYESE